MPGRGFIATSTRGRLPGGGVFVGTSCILEPDPSPDPGPCLVLSLPLKSRAIFPSTPGLSGPSSITTGSEL